jgi:sulfur-oxidizing protein SoxX
MPICARPERERHWAGILILALLAAPTAGAATLEPYRVVADAIPEPLGGLVGEATRGAALVKDRERGNCLICHHGEDPAEPFQGAIGPPLRGVGLRLSTGQIRLRLVDMSRLDPATVMPPYYRTENLSDVAEAYRGQPALTTQEIEDVVSYLATLRTE